MTILRAVGLILALAVVLVCTYFASGTTEHLPFGAIFQRCFEVLKRVTAAVFVGGAVVWAVFFFRGQGNESKDNPQVPSQQSTALTVDSQKPTQADDILEEQSEDIGVVQESLEKPKCAVSPVLPQHEYAESKTNASALTLKEINNTDDSRDDDMPDSSEDFGVVKESHERPKCAVSPVLRQHEYAESKTNASALTLKEINNTDDPSDDDTPDSAPTQSNKEFQKPLQDLDMLLIGKTGHGKSATGNSILQKKAFKTSMNSTSATFAVQESWVEFEDYIVKVVDGPGVQETRLDKPEATKKACNDMAEAMARCPKGFHALLLVLKYGNRFTDEEQESIQMLKNMFGQDILRNYCVIIVTHGDTFDSVNGDSDEPISFSQWLSQQEGALKKILIECSYRCVLFRNTTKDPKVKRNQLLELFSMVKSLKYRETRYTNAIFESLESSRQKLVVSTKAPLLKEEILKQTELIISDLNRLRENRDNLDANEAAIKKLEERVENLIQGIDEEDKETGALNDLKNDIIPLQTSIRSEKEINIQRREDMKERKRLNKEHEAKMAEMSRQNAETQRKLEYDLKVAKAEERSMLEKKLEEFSQQAKDRERTANEKFEKQRQKEKKAEEEKWKGALEQLNKGHTEQVKALRQQMEAINSQKEGILRKEIEELKKKLEEQQQQAKPKKKDPSMVEIRVKDQQNRVVVSEINKHSPMGQVIRAYCEQTKNKEAEMKFFFDGERVQAADTPEKLGLEDGDEIDALSQQIGGKCFNKHN